MNQLPRGHKQAVLTLMLLVSPSLASAQVRVFMAADGSEGAAPTTGNTTVSIVQGTTSTVSFWIEDTAQTDPLNLYQLIVPYAATPLAGATGSVTYVDITGPTPGDSVFVDTARGDFVFDGRLFDPPVYNETPNPKSGPPFFGAITGLSTLDAGVTVSGIRYLGAFDVSVSLDATGDFELPFVVAPAPPGVPPSGLFGPDGVTYPVDEWQTLTIDVQLCQNAAQCDDGDVCTTGTCNALLGCVVAAVDCAAFDSDCTQASCDPAGAQDNCDVISPANDGGPCNAGAATCGAGSCHDTRLFMAENGQQNSAPATGETMVELSQGGAVRVMVWIEDPGATQALVGYRLSVPWSATPRAGASGSVDYLDVDPGVSDGDSAVIDELRSDYVFNGLLTVQPVYQEDPPPAAQPQVVMLGFREDIAAPIMPAGVRYLGEFVLKASPDAVGEFDLALAVAGAQPTAMFGAGGTAWTIHAYQSLLIVVSDECQTVADCADGDADDIRDDNCVWFACAAGSCEATAIQYADMGGPNGVCAPDGTTDNNDRFQALNCFSNRDTLGNPGLFPCEDDPPMAFNVDAGGFGGACAPDGVCDGNDAFHAINVFTGVNTCSCASPAPGAPAGTRRPVPVTEVEIELVAAVSKLRPGEVFDVDVVLKGGLADLRGYQLHVATAGGRRGSLQLLDIGIHETDVFTAHGAAPWTAFNPATGQMVAGIDGPGIETAPGAYLATFVFQASPDATGTFGVELLHDTTDPGQRTFLFLTHPQGHYDIVADILTIEVATKRRSRLR